MSLYKGAAFLLIILIFEGFSATAQQSAKDSLLQAEDLSGIVVTATRSDRKMADVPMPVDIISKEQIESSGSSRLDEILSEQTGLAIVNDHGFGVQLQGMSPEYTLILVNGEPIIGRTAGTLDLTRISLNDVERIEIIKGPSSSLYGSDALAGVINIITKKSAGNDFRLRTKYASNQTFDNTLNAAAGLGKKGAISLSANRFSTEGYDLMDNTYGKTVDPYVDYTFRGNLHYQLTPKLKLQLNGHYFSQNQKNNYLVNTTIDSIVIKGKGNETDKRIAPVFTYKFSRRWKLKLRNYWSQYQTKSNLNDYKADTTYEFTYFRQNLWKEELQSEHILDQQQILTTGVGVSYQTLEASRYDEKKFMSDYFLYAQHEWHPTAKWNILTGLRYDVPSDYHSQLSPKIAAQYIWNSHWKFRASIGTGYKSPDFRQLYLDFTNNIVGYTVLGARVMEYALNKMQAEGQIAQISVPPDGQNTNLKPESSIAYNIGSSFRATDGWEVNVNLFRNDIKDLIDTRVVAIKSNGLPLFGYHNIHRVFTQGAEVNGSLPLFNDKLRISMGYQFLIAKDKEVVSEIKAGKRFKRDPETFKTEKLTMSDYGGLFNRSRNTFNIKVYYKYRSWSFNTRLLYRGRFGFADMNGDLILDDKDEYAPGYALLHLDAAKRFWSNRIKIEAGIKDLFNYIDPQHLPYVPGRTGYISASINLTKK